MGIYVLNYSVSTMLPTQRVTKRKNCTVCNNRTKMPVISWEQANKPQTLLLWHIVQYTSAAARTEKTQE